MLYIPKMNGNRDDKKLSTTAVLPGFHFEFSELAMDIS